MLERERQKERERRSKTWTDVGGQGGRRGEREDELCWMILCARDRHHVLVLEDLP